MAEIVSRQATKLLTSKQMPSDAYGKVRVITITSPASVTWAANDTIASGIALPIGTRILCMSYVSCADMGTSIVLDIGLRNFETQVAIDADGIANDIDVAAAATRAIANNGALVADGVEYVTTAVSEVYATISGGTPTANAQLRIEVMVVTND